MLSVNQHSTTTSPLPLDTDNTFASPPPSVASSRSTSTRRPWLSSAPSNSWFANVALSVMALSSFATRGVYGAPDHFILTQVPSIAFARMDPIISPGQVSGHVHNIMGGSAFSKDLPTAAQMTGADCSSAIVTEDKSNYWSPLLYYRYPNNTLAPMLGQNRIYYYVKGTNVQPFPPGLRMISGMAMTRDTSDPKTLGVMLSCDHGVQTPYFPNATTNPGGCGSISLGIFFPSCGLASKDLDSPDHFSHMTWPTQKIGSEMKPWPNGDVCPPSHPIKYPTIFFEANYYLGNGQQVWRNDPNLLVLANGDTTGTTYHADFVNGWPTDLLTNAIKQCPGTGNFPETCAAFKPLVNKDKAFACRVSSQIPDEDVGLFRPLSKLPGCNPLWTPDMGPKHPTCATPPPVPKFVNPNVYFQNLRYLNVIPLALPEAGPNPNNTGLRKTITPSVGATGTSRLGVWGQSSGTNDAKLKAGTYDEIIAGLATPLAPTNAGIAAANPSTSKVVQAASVPDGNADAMDTGSGTIPARMCKRSYKRSSYYAPGNVQDPEYKPMEQPPAPRSVDTRAVNEDYDEIDRREEESYVDRALEVLNQHLARRRFGKIGH